MEKKTNELLTLALNFLQANTDSVHIQERLLEITGSADNDKHETIIDNTRDLLTEYDRPKKKFIIEAVDSLITKLQALRNQGASVHVEAPIYLAGEQLPYRWPETDYCIAIVDVEEEEDSDGDSILLKSAVVFE